MRPRRPLVAAVSLAGALSAAVVRADDLTFTADRACLARDTVTLRGLGARVGDARVTAGTLRWGPRGAISADDVTVRPCGCVPLGLGARRATLVGDGVLALDGARLVLGGVSVPFAPRWWVLWGQRVGLLVPRVELRGGGIAAGPGVHLPLGRALGLDAWVLARGDGADLSAEATGDAGTLRLDAHGGGVYALGARGTLGWTAGRSVVAVRVDGATTDAAGRALARLPVESLRAGHEGAFGTSVTGATGTVVAGGVELARRYDDVGARTVMAVAAPDVAFGRTVLSARAFGGAWLGGTAQPFGDIEARATVAGGIGVLDALGYARAEAYGTRGAAGEGWTGVGRAGGRLALPLARRYGWGTHRLRFSVGVGAEGGTVTARAVAEAVAESTLAGRTWRWGVTLGGRASTGGDLPARVEARTELAAGALAVTGTVAADAVLAAAEIGGRWADARGDTVALSWAHRERSAWDLAPAWARPEAGPLDLEGVRARRRPGESAAAMATVALGRWALRGDGAVDLATGSAVLAGGAVRWRAVCGCAWVEAAGFWVRGGEVVAMVGARFGRP